MPTPRNQLSDYPRQYADAFRAARTSEVRIECANDAEAQARRSMLYTYRSRLLEEPEHDPELTLLAPSIKTRLERGIGHTTIVLYT